MRPYWIRVDSKSKSGCLYKEKEREIGKRDTTVIHGEEDPGMMEVAIGMMQVQTKDCQVPSNHEKLGGRQVLLYRFSPPPEGTNPASTLI